MPRSGIPSALGSPEGEREFELAAGESVTVTGKTAGEAFRGPVRGKAQGGGSGLDRGSSRGQLKAGNSA